MFDKLDTNIIDGMERGLLSTVFFDNETIKEIKESVSIQVIGNGDIFTAKDAIEKV